MFLQLCKRLRHWLRHTWISRISIFDRLLDWSRRAPDCSLPFPRECRPLLEQLEVRNLFAAQFPVSAFTTKDTAPYAVVTVDLDTPSPNTITVNYATSNGTAMAGTDYSSTSGTLTFAPEQLSNYFEVPILDGGHHGALTVNLALSSPTNTTLGSLADATLTILHDGTSGGKTTSVSLTSSDTSPVFSEPVTFTSVVSPAPHGHKVPTGDVEYFDGATLLGVGAIDSGGTASFTTMTLAGGSHSITAQYSGDNDYASSSSSAVTETVDSDPSTSTTLWLSTSSSVFGQTVTFTVTVAPVPPAMGTPTGTVNIIDNGSTLGTITLSSGTGSLTSSALSVGYQSITAAYQGDGTFFMSNSSTLSETVTKANTSTAVSSSANPSVFGQSVTFTATVSASAPGSGTPGGVVYFAANSTTLGAGTLTGGQATFSTSSLAVNTFSITAVYAGNSDYNFSTSSALAQTVSKAGSSTTLTSSVNPSVYGQSVGFTGTVSPISPGAGTPTGMETFEDGSTTLGTLTLSSARPPIRAPRWRWACTALPRFTMATATSSPAPRPW